MDKELLKGSIDIIMLSLAKAHDVYGYEIAKKIRDYTNFDYEMGEATLYPALKRIENKGFLSSRWGNSEKGGKRKYYTITHEGIIELEQQLSNWRTLNDLIEKCEKGDGIDG